MCIMCLIQICVSVHAWFMQVCVSCCAPLVPDALFHKGKGLVETHDTDVRPCNFAHKRHLAYMASYFFLRHPMAK